MNAEHRELARGRRLDPASTQGATVPRFRIESKPAHASFAVYEATSADQKDALYRFRYEIFTLEQGKYRSQADHEHGRLQDALDESATHLCVARSGEMVGSLRSMRGRTTLGPDFARNLKLDHFAEFPDQALGLSGRLMLRQSHRRSGALQQLLHANYERGRAAGGLFDFIHCSPHLLSFYERLGYRRYTSPFTDPSLGFQIPMVLVADDLEHFERLRSPFAAVARRWPSSTSHADWLHARFPDSRRTLSPARLGRDRFVDQLAPSLASLDSPLLTGLEASELRDLIAICSHLSLGGGTRLIRRGDLGMALYLILNGEVELDSSDPGVPAEAPIRLRAGDHFGEFSLLTGQAREIEVTTRIPTALVLIDRITLLRLPTTRPALASRLMFNLARFLVSRGVPRPKAPSIRSEPSWTCSIRRPATAEDAVIAGGGRTAAESLTNSDQGPSPC